MTNWLERRRACKNCRGEGYVYGERVYNLNGDHRTTPMWVSRCSKCQPQTMDELKEAAAQEVSAR